MHPLDYVLKILRGFVNLMAKVTFKGKITSFNCGLIQNYN